MNCRRWYEEDPPTIVIDVHYEDGRIKRGISLPRVLEVGEQLQRGDWVVEQVIPSPEPGVDFEAYVRKVQAGEVPPSILNYLVIKISDEGEASSESHRAIGLLAPGDIIASGVERWRVVRVKDRGGLVLSTGSSLLRRLHEARRLFYVAAVSYVGCFDNRSQRDSPKGFPSLWTLSVRVQSRGFPPTCAFNARVRSKLTR